MPRRPSEEPTTPLPALPAVLSVLADASRLELVAILSDGELRSTGALAEQVGLPASTCSYHLTKLLDAGITWCRVEGTHRYPVLRTAELEKTYPGLLGLVTAQSEVVPV
jgi:DNA-binding transcriptional ArsR family regulator